MNATPRQPASAVAKRSAMKSSSNGPSRQTSLERRNTLQTIAELGTQSVTFADLNETPLKACDSVMSAESLNKPTYPDQLRKQKRDSTNDKKLSFADTDSKPSILVTLAVQSPSAKPSLPRSSTTPNLNRMQTDVDRPVEELVEQHLIGEGWYGKAEKEQVRREKALLGTQGLSKDGSHGVVSLTSSNSSSSSLPSDRSPELQARHLSGSHQNPPAEDAISTMYKAGPRPVSISSQRRLSNASNASWATNPTASSIHMPRTNSAPSVPSLTPRYHFPMAALQPTGPLNRSYSSPNSNNMAQVTYPGQRYHFPITALNGAYSSNSPSRPSSSHSNASNASHATVQSRHSVAGYPPRYAGNQRHSQRPPVAFPGSGRMANAHQLVAAWTNEDAAKMTQHSRTQSGPTVRSRVSSEEMKLQQERQQQLHVQLKREKDAEKERARAKMKERVRRANELERERERELLEKNSPKLEALEKDSSNLEVIESSHSMAKVLLPNPAVKETIVEEKEVQEKLVKPRKERKKGFLCGLFGR